MYFGTLYNIKGFSLCEQETKLVRTKEEYTNEKIYRNHLDILSDPLRFSTASHGISGRYLAAGNDGGKVVQKKLENGALALQNDYLRVTLQKTHGGAE